MTEPVIETRALCKRFGALEASRDISLDLRVGEIHAVIGPNGAGKSTLISQICGGLQPDSGEVRLMGRDVTGWDVAARARAGIGRTFQVSALAMEDTVLQNALLGAFGASGRRLGLFRPALRYRDLRSRALAALDRVGLAGQAAAPAAELSHGERRRLEIAIALTLAPRAFVLDEPMAGLGSEGTKEITNLLNELRSEAPILLVEHDMDAVFALADRISVLVYGQVIATGAVEEIRANAEVRAAYLGDSA
ncbi:ABC transporter ATP-binding protein [Roseovarius spongiae]|uniref:ABC transporter ATP-binding protein n=1 Tax=Roseovarius spongiae TaxID=2320272 RepID=A0A3A8AYR6_9RHOB|nr:ABC transporter ATP-binding protein [Roseovarius spongiae]RKF17167.1 ABC transporter ATP-binding protein [Roseovarius spongiae]